MKKYAIDKQFFPFSAFTPPFMKAETAEKMNAFLHPPRSFLRNPDCKTERLTVCSFDTIPIECFLVSPNDIAPNAPCLIYYHGGGFLLDAAWYHYRLAQRYALAVGCKVLFVRYRLTPKHPFPIPFEDCYAAVCHAITYADALGIDPHRIAIGGDSAGGCLAAAVSHKARENGIPLRFQLLIYPVTDARMQTDSMKCFTDTPMWNAVKNKMMWEAYLPKEPENRSYASPAEAGDFTDLPPAYLETAEFDCLHDEGVEYAEKLQSAGVSVTLNETKGTMHGFDTVNRSITEQAVKQRIAYMKQHF